jgi:hypothetical protein
MRRGVGSRNVDGKPVNAPWAVGKREKKQANVRERQMVRSLLHKLMAR